MSVNGILQKQLYIHGLKHDITIAPHSLVPTKLHEFHDLKVTKELSTHLGNKKILWQDSVKYIGK